MNWKKKKETHTHIEIENELKRGGLLYCRKLVSASWCDAYFIFSIFNNFEENVTHSDDHLFAVCLKKDFFVTATIHSN